MEQEIHFCNLPDGGRLAYATTGSGSPLILIPGWVSQLDLSGPLPPESAALLRTHFSLVRYDKRGTGLSDRASGGFSGPERLADFEALVRHLGHQRFSVYASSSGCLTAMAYAAAHPERVDGLVLYGPFARGEAVAGKPQTSVALASLVRAEWGLASTALTDLLLPGASTAEREAYARAQMASADADVAARLIEAITAEDITDLLPRIKAPTLVIHSRGDRAVPFEYGREVAAAIPGARRLALDSDRHVLDPALSHERWRAVAGFLLPGTTTPLADSQVAQPVGPTNPDGLSRREVEVLSLIAAGRTNQQIADELVVSLNTVAHHVSNIFAKAGLHNRSEATAYAFKQGLTAGRDAVS